MLQSLNDVIDSVSFSENKLGGVGPPPRWSATSRSHIPTFGGQIERSAEDVRMTTYTDKNLRLPTDIQYAIGRGQRPDSRLGLPASALYRRMGERGEERDAAHAGDGQLPESGLYL